MRFATATNSTVVLAALACVRVACFITRTNARCQFRKTNATGVSPFKPFKTFNRYAPFKPFKTFNS